MFCVISMNHHNTVTATIEDQETWYSVNAALNGTIKNALTTIQKEKTNSSCVGTALISTI